MHNEYHYIVFESTVTIAVVSKVNLVNNMTKWKMDMGHQNFCS